MTPKWMTVCIALIFQALCSAQEPLLLKQFAYVEKELIEPQFDKLAGDWSVRAMSDRTIISPFHWQPDPTGQAIVRSDERSPGPLIRHLNGTRICRSEQGQSYMYLLFLYINRDYVIVLAVHPGQSGQFGRSELKVLARNGVEFDAQYIMQLLFNNLMVSSNVKQLIETFVFSLQFLDHTLTQYQAMPPKHFEENELALYTVDQLSGIFDIRYSTDDNDPEYVIATRDTDMLNLKKLKGHQLVITETDFHQPNSRRVLRVTAPVQPLPHNVRSVVSYVDYLFVDNNTIITYEFYLGKESIRIYVRQGQPITATLQSVPSTVLFKVRHLMPKLNAHYETKDQNIALEHEIVNQYASIEPEFEEVELDQLVGNWTLRATNLNKSEGFYSHMTNEISGEGLLVTKYNGQQSLGSRFVTRLLGTKALKSMSTDKSDLCITYVLYLDKEYYIAFGVRATVSGRPIYGKDGTPFDAMKLTDLLIKHALVKRKLKSVMERTVDEFEFTDPELTEFWPRPPVHFDENELADFDFDQIIGVFDLRYTSDGKQIESPFDYTVNTQYRIEKSIMHSLRMRETTILQNTTEAKFPNSRAVIQLGTVPESQRRRNLISRKYFISYLYVDSNVYIVYELYESASVNEHLVVYVRQGFKLSDEEMKSYLQRVNPTALNKVKHLVSNLTFHHNSIDAMSNVAMMPGIYRLTDRWPGRVNADFRSFQIVDNKMILKTFQKSQEIDELVLFNIKGTNAFQFRSTKTDLVGTAALAFTDITDRCVVVFNTESGSTINFYQRVKPKPLLINIKTV